MKREERGNVYQRQAKAQTPGTAGKTLKTQAILSLLLFLFCILALFSPGEGFAKAKHSISLVLTHHTDLQKEAQTLMSALKKDESLETVKPVSAMCLPVAGEIVKGFGVQDASKSGFHYGVDIQANPNAHILSAADGVVTEMATNAEYGAFIIVSHNDEISTLYGNLGELLPNVGDVVTAGQPLAKAGEAPFYFELRRKDTYLDPTQFIDFGA